MGQRSDLVRRLVPLVLATGAAFAVPAVALAQTASPSAGSSGGPGAAKAGPVANAPEQVVLSGSVVVPKGTSVGEVVVFHGRAVVSGSVQGDVVVLDGPITVAGAYVTGNVVALNGPIRVSGPSLIGGDVLGGERVSVEAGAKVGGQVRQDVGFTLQGPLAALGVLLGGAAIALSVLVLGLLLLLLAPRGADRVAAAASTAPFASLGWGVLVAIVLPVLAVALMVTIVGLPLGLTLLLALAFLGFVGLAWTAWAIGRALVQPPRNRGLAFLAGWGIVAVVGLVPFLDLALWVLGAAFGIGAMTVAIWRLRGSGRGGRHRARVAPEMPVRVPEAAAPPAPPEPEPEPTYPATSDD